MATLYLTEQGAVLRKKGRRLVVSKNESILFETPAFKVERVLIFGNIQVTSQTVGFLLESGIETSFLSSNGKFRGKLMPTESKNVLLRVAQYERYLDEHFQVEQSKRIVEAKIRNAKALLQRYSRNHPEVDFNSAIANLNQSLVNLQNKEKVATIRGVEGQSSAVYFKAFGQMFRKELQFSKRIRHPPGDPVNALLSFGYTLITNEALSILSGIGFDPYIGYLHGINYGRPSLALDLVEEFRQPVVDRLTLNLVNNRVLGPEDFENRDEEGIFLRDDARKRYFIQYEKMMNSTFKDRYSGENVTFRSLFKRQAHRLSKTIQTSEAYEPFLLE